MPNICFRLLHRARSRSQRRRVYSWGLVISVLLFLLVYSHNNNIFVHRPSLAQISDQFVKRSDISAVRGADMKLLGADDDLKYGGNVDTEEEDGSRADLLPDLAPPIVHFVWCGRRKFEYRHYLSIKRADSVIQPDKIFFHHQHQPVQDYEGYYTWFDQLVSQNDHIILKSLNNTSCPEAGTEKYMLVLSILEMFGGIFIPEDAILVDFPVHLRTAQFVSGVVARTLTEYWDGVIVAKKHGFISPSSQAGLHVVLASGRSADHGGLKPCGTMEHYNAEEDGDCICVKAEQEIYPSDTWEGEKNFAILARLAGYESKSVSPRFNTRTPIPKIGHYICWDCELKFNTYLSVMSALYVAGLNKVYIHGIKPPTGLWWRRLQATQRVLHVHREYPEHSHEHAYMTQELAQGIMRVSILLKYGGVFCDSKVIWTNAIPETHFGYDAVAAPNWHQYGAWPDSVSHSSIMAKKNSEYLVMLKYLHSQNHKRRFWFVDQYLSYKALEQHPDVLYLDRHFQVKCLNHHCHPTWLPGYKSPRNENPPGAPFDWENDTLSVDWDVFPDLELDTVKYTSGPVVAAARRVLLKAGISLHELTAS